MNTVSAPTKRFTPLTMNVDFTDSDLRLKLLSGAHQMLKAGGRPRSDGKGGFRGEFDRYAQGFDNEVAKYLRNCEGDLDRVRFAPLFNIIDKYIELIPTPNSVEAFHELMGDTYAPPATTLPSRPTVQEAHERAKEKARSSISPIDQAPDMPTMYDWDQMVWDEPLTAVIIRPSQLKGKKMGEAFKYICDRLVMAKQWDALTMYADEMRQFADHMYMTWREFFYIFQQYCYLSYEDERPSGSSAGVAAGVRGSLG